ncbi:MAG TPA: tyrosine-protein phosphatase [Asanoa sp.]|nr:tyrosine-protein phosphatase [Asanoa sp.]
MRHIAFDRLHNFRDVGGTAPTSRPPSPDVDPVRFLADRNAEVLVDGVAPAEAMRLTLKELAATHGSAHDYARDRLGADDALLAALRAGLLDP